MSTAAKYDIRIASADFASAVRAALTASRKRTRTRPSTVPGGAAGSALRRPQRFGDSYQWPDGSWTQSG